MPNATYAHSLENQPPEKWETMAQHEEAVAKYCCRFLKRINPDLNSWGELLGRWHDLGKYSGEFQAYLEKSNDPNASCEGFKGRVDHSSAGAQYAFENYPNGIGKMLAFVIAGHHAGLADAYSMTGNKDSGLLERLKQPVEPYRENAPNVLLIPPPLTAPTLGFSKDAADKLPFETSVFVRMLFSALCDADFLATEEFISPEKTAERPVENADVLCGMRVQLEKHLDGLNDPTNPSEVNQKRSEILQLANDAARLKPGFYSFTVPTGGGKTLSSLSFALRHAIKNDLARIIYAIPFTSIIEQTADVFRDVFKNDPELVLEHHGNVDPDKESRVSRLATQNWDSPLVVTTNVQLFESLFANRTSRCRKLHRIARSVIILDEVQTLPVTLLQPCLAMLETLVNVFDCTVLLCTATQPAFSANAEFPIGINGVHEIIKEPDKLYEDLKRVKVVSLGELTNEQIVDNVAENELALCIVNTKRHAADLYQLLAKRVPAERLFHLSTNMCAAHRTEKFKTIRRRLDQEELCIVVSTQLIEAGVDVDFPVVFRSMTGLDSIAQAAGRCNREGKLPNRGKVFLFDPTDVRLRGELKLTAQSGAEVIRQFPDDPLALQAIEEYFRLHYWQNRDLWDGKKVMECFKDLQNLDFQFRTAADRFRMIEDTTRSVFVLWDSVGVEIEKQIQSTEFAENPRFRKLVLRRLQRYVVPVCENDFNKLVKVGEIELFNDQLGILLNQSMYQDDRGFDLTKSGFLDPAIGVI